MIHLMIRSDLYGQTHLYAKPLLKLHPHFSFYILYSVGGMYFGAFASLQSLVFIIVLRPELGLG